LETDISEMGFYLKKGINFGPLRLNVSKSGLGMSFGAKGLRLGYGTKGSYIHAGRQGLYYRKNLSLKLWLILIGCGIVGYVIYLAIDKGIITINL